MPLTSYAMPSLPIDLLEKDVAVSKQRCRAYVRAARRNLAADTRALMDDTLCMHVYALPCFTAADTIFGFYPIQEEPNILPVLQKALDMGKTLALPLCDPTDCTMSFHAVSSLDALANGHYGIREPLSDAPRVLSSVRSLCLVPALAFDCHGHRIGYGKGYYDRFLADYRGLSMGIGYSSFLFDTLPCEPTDQTVSIILTERGILLPDESDSKSKEPVC